MGVYLLWIQNSKPEHTLHSMVSIVVFGCDQNTHTITYPYTDTVYHSACGIFFVFNTGYRWRCRVTQSSIFGTYFIYYLCTSRCLVFFPSFTILSFAFSVFVSVSASFYGCMYYFVWNKRTRNSNRESVSFYFGWREFRETTKLDVGKGKTKPNTTSHWDFQHLEKKNWLIPYDI